jgi:signal peptidase II
MTPKLRIGLAAFLITLAIDLGSKFLIEANLHFGDRVEVIEGFFYLTHVRNPGAAFGMGANAPKLFRLTFFIGVSTVAVGIILWFFYKLAPGDRLSALALGMILGGAVGNLVDRIRYQEVVDFLHFRLWQGYSWPDFNFADSFIVVGVGLLVLELLATEGQSESGAPHGSA